MRWLLFLIAMIGLSYAAGTDVFYAVFPAAVVMVAVMLGLLNMAADVFSLPSLSAYVKTELSELVAGVILALIVFAFIIGSDQLTTLLIGKSATDAAISHLQNLIGSYVTTYDGIIRIGTQLKAMITFNTQQVYPAMFISWGHTIGPFAGVAPFLTSLTMAVQGVSNNILLYQTILLLLSFSRAIILPVVLPFALALRLLPFTRQAGTMIVALCITMLVIFPWSIVFVDQIHNPKVVPYPDPTANGAVDSIIATIGVHFPAIGMLETLCQNDVLRAFLELNELGNVALFCPPICLGVAAAEATACLPYGYVACFAAFFWECFEICFNTIVYSVYPAVSAGAQLVYNTLGTMLLMNSNYSQAGKIFDAMYPFLKDINNLVVMGYVDALVISVFTIVGARSVSAALGGEWYMLRFQRLV